MAEQITPSDDMMACIDPDMADEFKQAYAQHMSEMEPRIPSAPRGLSSRIVRGGEHKPTNAEVFADFIRNQTHWA